MEDTLLTRFLTYVRINTQSDEKGLQTPSTDTQFELGNLLKKQLVEMGLKAEITENCIVYGYLPANTKGKDPIGFLSHLDTSPEASGLGVEPIVHEDYDGKIIKLSNGINIDPDYFSRLQTQVGKTIITASGTTLLGADDKAGISEIMEMLSSIIVRKIQHGDVYVAFTPDEEIGGGISSFDFKKFKAKYAFTVDGGEPFVLNYENFNATGAEVEIKGIEVHPGDAKNKMINAIQVGKEFLNMLPENMRPEYTENYEGFNHCLSFSGNTGHASLSFILRNHDEEILSKQKENFKDITNYLNKRYGDGTVTTVLKDQYKNMKNLILKDMTCVDVASKAIEACGLELKIVPIRGGTDGAKLTTMGLKTPNIGTGGYNYHGKYEYAVLEEMHDVVEILLKIVEIC